MLDGLFVFYKENVITYRLVFQFMRVRYFLMQFFFFLLLVSIYLLVYGLCIMLLANEPLVAQIGLFGGIAAAVLLTHSMWQLNRKAKTILGNQYGLEAAQGVWRTAAFETLQADLLKKYLLENGLYADDKLKLLIEGYEAVSRNDKYPILLNSGILISLSVPLWIQFVTFAYKSVKTLEDATWLLLSGVTLVLILISLISFTKWFFGELQDAVVTGDRAHRKTLIERLQDARLRYQKAAERPDGPPAPSPRKIRGAASPRFAAKRRGRST